MSKFIMVIHEDEETAVKALKNQLETNANISANEIDSAKTDLSGLIDYNRACINCWSNYKNERPHEEYIYNDLISKAENSNKKYKKLLSMLAAYSAKYFGANPVTV